MKYIIHGYKFADTPTFYDWDKEHKYPNFEIVDNVEIEREADSMDEAYKWMLENIPGYAIGCAVFSEDKKNFLLNPVKGYYACIGLPDVKQETIVAFELANVTARIERQVRK